MWTAACGWEELNLWASKSGTRGRASTTSPPGRWSESSEAEDLEHYNTILSFIEELSQWGSP